MANGNGKNGKKALLRRYIDLKLQEKSLKAALDEIKDDVKAVVEGNPCSIAYEDKVYTIRLQEREYRTYNPQSVAQIMTANGVTPWGVMKVDGKAWESLRESLNLPETPPAVKLTAAVTYKEDKEGK